MRAGARHSPRRTLILAVLGAIAVMLVLAPGAFAGVLSPENSGGSPNAESISVLYKISLGIAVVVFVGVEGLLVYSLVKFRFRRGGPAPAQIRGNAPLEIGWTIGAAVLLVVLTVITFVYLGDIENPAASGPGGLQTAQGVELASVDQPAPPGGEPLTILVNGQQYLWRYQYPASDGKPVFTYHEMVVPIHTTVSLKITSQDVAHSWWIPDLGGKADAIPGYTNETWFKIEEPGIYRGQCAELCGEGHADMRAQVRAMPVDQYNAWVTRQAADIESAQQELAVARRKRARADEQP